MPDTWKADDRHGPRPNEIYLQVGETDMKFLNNLWQWGVATVFSAAVEEKDMLLPEWTQSGGHGRIFQTSDAEPRVEGGVRLSQAKKGMEEHYKPREWVPGSMGRNQQEELKEDWRWSSKSKWVRGQRWACGWETVLSCLSPVFFF